MRAGLGGISLVITKNAKISMATCIGLFLIHSTCPMLVNWKVFPVIKEAWLMEAPFVWNTEHLQWPQQGKRDWRVTNGLFTVQAGRGTWLFCSH